MNSKSSGWYVHSIHSTQRLLTGLNKFLSGSTCSLPLGRTVWIDYAMSVDMLKDFLIALPLCMIVCSRFCVFKGLLTKQFVLSLFLLPSPDPLPHPSLIRK